MAASEMIAMMKVLPGWVIVFSIREGERSEAQHLLLNLCVAVTPSLNAMPFKQQTAVVLVLTTFDYPLLAICSTKCVLHTGFVASRGSN